MTDIVLYVSDFRRKLIVAAAVIGWGTSAFFVWDMVDVGRSPSELVVWATTAAIVGVPFVLRRSARWQHVACAVCGVVLLALGLFLTLYGAVPLLASAALLLVAAVTRRM